MAAPSYTSFGMSLSAAVAVSITIGKPIHTPARICASKVPAALSNAGSGAPSARDSQPPSGSISWAQATAPRNSGIAHGMTNNARHTPAKRRPRRFRISATPVPSVADSVTDRPAHMMLNQVWAENTPANTSPIRRSPV